MFGVKHRKVGLLVLLVISSLLMGCWSIFGVEESYVKEISENGLFNILLYGIILVVIINLILRAIKTGKKSLFIGIISVIVGIALSHTILGTIGYWIFNAVIGWGVLGIILWVLLSAAQGFAPGFFGVIPIGLYIAYQDPRLLMYYAIPALIADLLEAIIRKKPEA